MAGEIDLGEQPTTEELRDQLGTEKITYVDALSDELSTLVKEAHDLKFDYLIGDLSDYGVSANGHAHFDLVHGHATIHCVLFGFRRNQIGTPPEEGVQVAVKGDLSYYAEGGSVSVIVHDILEVGDGVYQQTYEQNRKTLAEDGLLDPDAKQVLPSLPARIGIVTSADSDAREDAVTSIHSRHPDVDLVIQDSTVQGDNAMASMMEAISRLDDNSNIDVIVLTRGGGADKDLRVFNETPLCRVIHRSATSVVVAVGHEADKTLAEEVADERAMTPSHVGRIVPDKTEQMQEFASLEGRLSNSYRNTVETGIAEFDDRLSRAYRRQVDARLSDLRTHVTHAYTSRVQGQLTTLESRLNGAREQYDQQRQHRKETERYRRQRRRLLVGLVVLSLLALALIVFILLNP